MVRFNRQSVRVKDLTILLTFTALFKRLKDKHFKLSLSKNSPKTMVDLRLWSKKCINTKEII